MKIIRGVIPALALTAACAMPPDGTDEQDAANYDAAVASVGCDLRTESEYLAVELQTGLSRAQLQDMSEYKVQTGAAQRLESGGVRLVTGSCAPAESVPATDTEEA